MDKAACFGQLAKEHYGSRKGHKAIDQALNKRLTVDMAALQGPAFVLYSQDAMSCFDRISHAVLAIGLKRQNLPHIAIESLINIIETMVHKVCTVLGESSSMYGANNLLPCQGISQGCGMSPPGWAVDSSTNFEMLQSANYGAKFSTPMLYLKIEFVEYAYVDDTDQKKKFKMEG